MATLLKDYLDAGGKDSSVIAYLASLDHLSEKAPEIAVQIMQELEDQRSSLKLIASENYSSLAVQLAMGNLLTDKYCEGFPFHRFYAGCEHVDVIEDRAAKLAQQLFGMDHAYVQPHSGADANLVAFWAIILQRVQCKELGKKSIDELSEQEHETLRRVLCNQTVMGLSLGSGGHLTHGYRHNVSAKMMRAVNYDVDPKTGLLDYEQIRQIALKEKPLILLAGYSAYPRAINFAKMRAIADEVGAVLMVDMAHFAGLVAAKVFEGEFNPMSYADVATTTTHKTLRGPRGGLILCTEEFKDAINKGCPLVLGGPLPHVIAAKAICFQEALSKEFQDYGRRIVQNAQALAEGLKEEGFKLWSDGTENHLLVIDLSDHHLTGRQAELALREGGITANRNMVPFDPEGPWYTSGIRLGTPAVTTLGMGPEEMREIARLIGQLLHNTQPATVARTGLPSKAKFETTQEILGKTRAGVVKLLSSFPLYPEIPAMKGAE